MDEDVVFYDVRVVLKEIKAISKVESKVALCLISLALCHEDVWGSGGTTPRFLASALHGGEWSASRRCRFTPRGISSS
jgi:hypothetical protein